jgi:hypothetical protein
MKHIQFYETNKSPTPQDIKEAQIIDLHRSPHLDQHVSMQFLHFLGGDFANDLSHFLILDKDANPLIMRSISREGCSCLYSSGSSVVRNKFCDTVFDR